ncbi:MAG: hypothetical protein EKK35_17845 [Bradyrhizobiaceae bacterium]|nr:MAG: hypothetical protein EKK35_17845 [Bradyrhizobiaceae bacterium]
MKPLTTKQRFPGSFDEFDRLLFRIPDPGRWWPHEGRRAYCFKYRTVRVTWFERPRSYLVEGEDRMHVLFIDAEIKRLRRRFGFLPKAAAKNKPSPRNRRPPLRVADIMADARFGTLESTAKTSKRLVRKQTR